MDFSIQLAGLKNGNNRFEYELGDDFFAEMGGEKILGGDVKAVVNIEKAGNQMRADVSVGGVVRTTCDRCLEEMEVEIENDEEFGVRVSSETSYEDEEMITIAEDDGMLQMGERMYEMCVVAMPIVCTHKEGECNAKMIEILEAHSASNNEEKSSDPRWDALKNIINK